MHLATCGRDRTSLDGEWHFTPDPYDQFVRIKAWEHLTEDRRGGACTPEHWPTLAVPGSWNAQREDCTYLEGPAVYWRRFACEAKRDRRYFLHFGAANHRARAFVNGVEVGCHEGGFTPFAFEVTDEVRPGDRNTLFVRVNAVRRPEDIPTMQTDWFLFAGLTRSVTLVETPRAFVRNFKFTPRLAPDNSWKAEFRVWVDGAEGGEARVRLPELGVDARVPVAPVADPSPWGREFFGLAEGAATVACKAEAWGLGRPRLYDIEIAFGEDALRDEVGFVEVRTEGQKILVNGEPVFLRGVSLHEEADGKGRTLGEAEVAERFEWIERLGCNFARLAHYPHTEAMVREAARRGIGLWEEVPVYWKIDFSNEKVLANAKGQLRELVQRDWNRPSVLMWSVANETPRLRDGRLGFLSELAALSRALDPSRPVCAALLHNWVRDPLQEVLDVCGINEYSGWYGAHEAEHIAGLAESVPAKPFLISETGAGAPLGNSGRPKDEMWSVEYQEEFYRRKLAALDRVKELSGLTPWILFDFASPMRINKWQNGFNRKGLLSEKGEPKPAHEVVRKFYGEKAAGK